MAERYLLDTCAVIWLSDGAPMAERALAKLAEAETADQPVSISVMTAWETGMLMSKNRLQSTKPPLKWYEDAVAEFGAEVVNVSPQVLVASSFLPGPVNNDPVDRILIATAREHDFVIVTRDRAILEYGELGHLKTLAC